MDSLRSNPPQLLTLRQAHQLPLHTAVVCVIQNGTGSDNQTSSPLMLVVGTDPHEDGTVGALRTRAVSLFVDNGNVVMRENLEDDVYVTLPSELNHERRFYIVVATTEEVDWIETDGPIRLGTVRRRPCAS